jgi:hypothetical protein
VEEGGTNAQETGRVDLGVGQKGTINSPAKLAMKRRKVLEITGPVTPEARSENRIKT